MAKPAPKPAVKAAAKPTVKAAAKPTAKPDAKTAPTPAAKTVAKPAPKAAAKPAPKPVAKVEDRSSNHNVRDAIKKLRALKSRNRVMEFVKGEKRATVTKAIPTALNRLK